MSQDDKEHNKVHRYLIRLFLHIQLDFFNDLNQKSDEKKIFYNFYSFLSRTINFILSIESPKAVNVEYYLHYFYCYCYLFL